MSVTPAQAGVQFKNAWIPACAGMTNGQHASVLLNNIFETHYTIDIAIVRPIIYYGANIAISE